MVSIRIIASLLVLPFLALQTTASPLSNAFVQQRQQLLENHRASVWEPEFPTQQSLTTDDEPLASPPASQRSTNVRGRSKIALRYEPNEIMMGLAGGYYGEISLGTPPQTFTMAFNSLTNDVWVTNFSSGSTHKFYNHSKSSSYTPNGTDFGNSEWYVSGFVSQDTMLFGGFEIKNQAFGEVDNIDNFPEFPASALDGIFGLGLDFVFNPVGQMVTPIRELVDSGVLDEPVVTFYFDKGIGGELTIGGVDKNHFSGDITYVQLFCPWAWLFPIDGITVNEKRVTKFYRTYIVTILPVIWGPIKEVEALAKIVGADVDNDYEIDCSSDGPEIVFQIGGVKFPLTKDDYTLRTKGSSTCHWAINPMPEITDAWILGVPFIEKYYTIFDWGNGSKGRPRMGFALRA